ncbi:MAG: sugar transferase [Anaerolineaceae bacterium]|nr:sugar transferase [Anaerolineaceae bacterium]
MFRRFSTNFAIFSMILDFLLIEIAIWLAALLRVPASHLNFIQLININIRLPIWIYPVFPLIWVGIMFSFSLYDGKKNFKFADEFSSLLWSSAVSLISLAGILFFTYRDLSRFLFLLFAFFAFMFLLIWRSVYRIGFRKKWFGNYAVHKVLVLGSGTIGRSFFDQLFAQSDLGIRVIGFLDDDKSKQRDLPDVLGSLDSVKEMIEMHHVDDVVLALPRSAHQRLSEIVNQLHEMPVKVWVIPDYFSLTLHKATVEEFGGIPMLDLRAPALTDVQRMNKRIFDILFGLIIFPVVVPVIGLTALLIRLVDGKPVFFTQRRVGENGKLFRIIKFRTMVVDADKMQDQVTQVNEKGDVVYKTPDDPRITRIGKILRRTSIDEFPQYFNIMRGEMSFVGPRPELPSFVKNYATWQRKRFTVPQGLTGWWQINGRSDKPMYLHTEDDLYYVQHYSIWLDLQIIFKTVIVVIRRKGAY